MNWIAILIGASAVLAVGVVVLAIILTTTVTSEKAREKRRIAAMLEQRATIEEVAVEAERTRILREMHDIIAHSLAIMVAQADGGSFVCDDPEAAKRAFTTIADTGRAAVDETRRVLGMLKTPEGQDRTPIPDQFNVEQLVESARASGMQVFLIRLGQPRTLPAGLGLTLYRICQEALTNAMKHAAADAQVTVTENWKSDEVIVTITDQMGTEPPRGEPGLGQGLTGMKERASSVGATITAEPYDEGFRVRLVLPLPEEEFS
ncbi:MAG: histidine kinase [Propionibacteriaceae bacterium]|nr:histidine kinase [Propionibacteriaceae bacterium]